jgi:hypothetical protein
MSGDLRWSLHGAGEDRKHRQPYIVAVLVAESAYRWYGRVYAMRSTNGESTTQPGEIIGQLLGLTHPAMPHDVTQMCRRWNQAEYLPPDGLAQMLLMELVRKQKRSV